jgi:Fe-S-cluster containining protein
MFLERQIRQWQQGILNNYCKSCSDHCCNTQKHRIYLDGYSIPLFREKGIPLVTRSRLDVFSLTNWKNNRKVKLLFRDGSEIQKPSIIEIPRGMFGIEFYLYADICPFYKDNRCEIHEDQRRPSVCEQYPILFLGCNDPEGKMLDISIMRSCECFRREEIRSGLTEKFPVRIIED